MGIKVSIVGASGYTGGELLRLLLFHPEVEIQQVTSERLAGKLVHGAHPNLRKLCRLKFSSSAELEACDTLFLCLPHGQSMGRIDEFQKLAGKLVDLSSDFRLTDAAAYEKWYRHAHQRPDLLESFVYGIPELHRETIRDADRVACAGCNATATILALYPLVRQSKVDHVVVEVKAGSSEGGNSASDASHHPERSGVVRSYKPSGHRHVAEMIQELGGTEVHFSATSIEMVRGILATCHVFLSEPLEEKEVWRLYRQAYADEPFIRIVKERTGIHRYPEPKLLSGTNYCDIGFERDPDSNRLVVISAIDNLMKGGRRPGAAVFQSHARSSRDPGAHVSRAAPDLTFMCRLLCIRSREPFAIGPHLEVFAGISQNSREYQGHGWGCAWLTDKGFQIYRNIKPVWEDDKRDFGTSRLLLAHARSAFRDEGVCVEKQHAVLRWRARVHLQRRAPRRAHQGIGSHRGGESLQLHQAIRQRQHARGTGAGAAGD